MADSSFAADTPDSGESGYDPCAPLPPRNPAALVHTETW
jgi:hypothetical protein